MAHPTALARSVSSEDPVGSRTDRSEVTATAGHPGRWLVAVVLTVLVAAVIPLAWQPRWYFFGDTQIGAFGQWYHLGRMLRAGQWPLLDVQGWGSGNFVAEGQWGLFSPLTALIGLLATVVPNAVVFTTVVKFVLLAGGALGVYCLVRSYRVGPAAAFIAAVASTTGGVTQYLESPSWVTGQMVWALLPLFWWQLRRVTRQRANPLLALVFGLSMVAIGYVYGVLYVAIAVLGCMVDAFRARNRPGAARSLAIGVLCGLLAVTVYLPAVLTAPVTVRGAAVLLSDGNLQGTVFTTVTSMLPLTTGPATYVVWFLPALAWLGLGKLRTELRPLTGLLIGLFLTLAWVIGPNQVGPIRWPLRVLPILTLFLITATVILVARARIDRFTLSRLRAALVVLAAAAFVTVSRNLDETGPIMAGTGVAAIGLTLTWATLRRAAAVAAPGPTVAPTSAPTPTSTPSAPSARSWLRTPESAVVIVVTAVTLAVVVLQHALYPQPPSVNRHMPTRIADYSGQAAAAKGDVLVVGDPEPALLADRRVAQSFLIASSWYLSPQIVQNEYTTIGFKTYNQRYCVHYNGTSCSASLSALFSREPGTKVRRVDLLSISTLLIYRQDFPARRLATPPKGWHTAASTDWALTWVRDDPLPSSGGVSWESSGTAVDTVSESQRTVVLSVRDVPDDGGRVVLSRLDWPGYQVSGAVHAAPLDGYLLTVDVPASAKGATITIHFDPPGWTVEETALAVSGLGSLVWVLVDLVLIGLRRRRPGSRGPSRVDAG